MRWASAVVATAARSGGRGRRVPGGTPGSVLVLEYMLPLGACLHLTPVYEALKRSRPDMVVTVATRGLGAQLLRHHRFVDHLIETPDALVDSLGAMRTLRGELKLRGVQPDCALTGASDQRTRIALLALLSGAAWRGGYTQAPELYQRPLVYDWGISLIDNNLRLAELAGASAQHLEPRVFCSTADAEAAEALAREANPDGRPLLVMVTQTSGGQRTTWHTDRFVKVARFASEVMGFALAFVGVAGDRAAIQQMLDLAGTGISLAGRTSVTQIAALLAISDFVVSLDTGTMHVGRAVGVPMVVLGPSWQKTTEWMPLGLEQVRILRGPDRADIPPGYQLDEVEVEHVTEALRDLVQTYPPDAEKRRERVTRLLSPVDHLVREG